ncbi:MAG: acyltransferase [Bacilli bacterium]|jgi:acetyltransferase-like isoleucine patch superfamily enzyme|nr:acyltransferase [Bacilli bacterium]
MAKISLLRIFKHFRKKAILCAFLKKTHNKNAKNIKMIDKVKLRGNPKIVLGNNVKFYSNILIWGDGELIIGNNVEIGDNTIIYVSKEAGISIGDNTLIAANCYFIDMNHSTKTGMTVKSQPNTYGKIKIGNNVWIGEDVTILKNVEIGQNAVIGAKSLCNKNIKPNSIYAGVPARFIKDK